MWDRESVVVVGAAGVVMVVYSVALCVYVRDIDMCCLSLWKDVC